MASHRKVLLPFILILFILSACSQSLDTVQAEVVAAAQEAFNAEQKEPNKGNEFIQYYLPFGFEIQSETTNNIILKNGAKKYILFYNHQEEANSKVVYEATAKQQEYEVNETFSKDEEFGFILIKKINDDLNELTVGIGGVKVTSELKTRSLKSEVAYMMAIANSIKIK